jgi:Lipocalin-like domain
MIRNIVLCLAVLAGAVGSTAATMPAGLPGTWQVVSRADRDASGKVVPEPSLGSDPAGYLIYDNAGHVAAQLSARARSALSCEMSSSPDKNNPAHIGGFEAYFGRYEVDPAAGTVTHIIDGALLPGDVGRRVTRRFHLEGDTLTIQFEPGVKGVTRTIVWRRISE